MNVEIKCKYQALVALKDLKPHPKNRNTHSKEQIDRLVKIFNYQGIRHTIKISNLSGFIVAGHGRLEAAKKLKLKEFPVEYQDFESEEQEYAFLVSDNSIASWAELDLAQINLDMLDLGPMDIDLLGLKEFVVDMSEIKTPEEKPKKEKACPHCGAKLDA